MIDLVYQIVQTIVNKELRGNVTPAEYNLLAEKVQSKIFRGYFEDENRDKNKENRGLTNKNYSHLSFLQRQRIDQFSKTATLTFSTPNFDAPADLYFIKDRGLDYNGNIINEVQSADIVAMLNSSAAPSTTFPIYEQLGANILVYPASIVTGVTCRYVRKPLAPKWTYTIVSGSELYNPSAGDHQDFELHISELSNIVIELVSYFGINLRETEVTQYAEALKRIMEVKEEQ